MNVDQVFNILGLCAIAAPVLLVAVLGVPLLFNRRLSEQAIAQLTQLFVVAGLLASVGILGMMLAFGVRHVPVVIGDWVVIPGGEHAQHHFHFTIKLLFDRLSVPFTILTYILCGTIAAFANAYLHREPGYRRFFMFFALFQLGMVLTSVAGTIETLFAGWELVGLSSALLVAFFHERPSPVRNGLRVWMVYRVADAAFLVAAIALHHLTGEGDFDKLTGTTVRPWPEGVAVLTSAQATFVGLLLIVAAAGKSALIPFSGWLPRAMEGPTPSSAVFYGALSVHLGAYMLLRVSPILEKSPFLWGTVILLGATTSLYAAVTARVQTDIKSALAFASLTQIGLIVCEIGLGAKFGYIFWYLALVHMIGHACLRTLQFLRAPTLLRDYHLLENAIGSHLPQPMSLWERQLPEGLRIWVYRLALERGYLDALLADYVVAPFLAIFRQFNALELQWDRLLSGRSDAADVSGNQPSVEVLEESA